MKTNINGDIFYHWCKYTLIQSLKRKCVIMMDNASFHKRVNRLLNRHGHRLLFLPPYSPDLNPIEKNGLRYRIFSFLLPINVLNKRFFGKKYINIIYVIYSYNC
ncbi:transposase [Psychrobacter urativorans]|uniref:transposase n=1 Tax=Psychrobacter urativorans TaxID=45610 RepID=UPI003B588CA3